MHVTNILYEDFVNYKKPSMFIGSCYCDFKCCKEGSFDISVCQNSSLRNVGHKDVPDEQIFEKYQSNPITQAIVIGGLEPFLQYSEVFSLIKYFREHGCMDDFVIYTGYNKFEIKMNIEDLQQFPNIIVKFGRFLMNDEPHKDSTLGVTLMSHNQYAERIS